MKKSKTMRDGLLATTAMVGGAGLMVLTAIPVAALVAPTSAAAQSQSGSLRVGVSGDNGAPVAGATVTVSSPDSLVSRSGVTGADGSVRLGGLDPATNYTVRVSASGYNDFSASNVAVISGRDLSLGYILASSGGSTLDDVIVTGTSLAAVDVTSATVATTLTLDTVESLPTGRSYQSYLQLVPGVKPTSGGNPASRSGVNYSDIGGAIGASTDNLYYLDGVDVTDPITGTFGANFNSEIIQEQSVIVGGVPAEYAGGSGLISRVLTKSGSNEWHGSLNYYFQNDSLVQEDKHAQSQGFSTYDTAFTLGGPILRDRLWIFGSFQRKNREDEVVDPATGNLRRTVNETGDYTFLKATWQITPDDRLAVTYFSDPTEISGRADAAIINRRDFARIQGGDKFKIDYSRTWGNLLFNAYYFKHEAELTNISVDQSIRDNVSFRGPGSTIEQRQLGGRGLDNEEHRDREEFGLTVEYFLETSFGSHTIKAGYSDSENQIFQVDSVPGGMVYASIAPAFAGATFANFTSGAAGWTARPFAQGDLANFILPAVNANVAARTLLDTDASGAVTAAEMNAYAFTSSVGNPYGNINAYRAVRTANAPYTLSSRGQSLYLQDTWTLGQLTVNAGLRAERWEHFASDGSNIATFDWDVAPRLSVVYDLNGDGRSKIFGFVGRYYDPIRNNMTDFAGALTGPVNEEQIYIGDQWITFRVRGPGDAAISPSTRTPYTDEFMLGYSTTFGRSIGLTASITRRKTRDIMEDFDLSLYSDPAATAADGLHGVAYPGSLFYIPLSYFGYTANPGTNYVVGTMPGGKRNYTGFEVALTKFRTENWFGQVSYTYNSAQGNTNSDSNADFQGDWIALDPRAPNAWGDQPGNIKHQFKAHGAYAFDFGLEVSGVFNWNSGALYTPAQLVSARFLAPMDAPYEYGGITDSWLSPGFIGAETGPAYYTFDMRFRYVRELPVGEAEFFLDVFNVLDNQAPIDEQKLLAGNGIYGFGEANAWVAPRRAYLGVRYSF